MPMRNNPFEDIEQMFDRMGRRLEETRMDVGGEIATAAVDVAEWDGEFIVTADLPGYEKEDIDLRITDQTLQIEAEHKAETEEPEEKRYLRRERARTSVSRSVRLPEEVDREGASASYENGVLTVTVPKAHAGEEEGSEISIS